MTSNKKQKTIGKLALNIAIAGVLMTTYGSRSAYAGTCSETVAANGIWVCSGVAGADTTQATTPMAGGTLSATTDPNFGITTAAGHAITLTNAAADTNIVFADANASPINGALSGIYADNNGTGSTSITTSGIIMAGQNGIAVDNASTSSNLTISSQANVTGDNIGITTNNAGTGQTTITTSASAAVTGTTYHGISASNNGTDLTIYTQAAVTGNISGIYTNNGGSGNTTVTNTATVTGTGGPGISTNTNGLDLTIDSQAAVSGYTGISANNNGTGAISITTTGIVTGAANDGIDARISNLPGGTDLTIDAQAAVTGQYNGITARNSGNGETTISHTDTVTGIASYGIFAANSGTNLSIGSQGDVSGAYSGITAVNSGSGYTMISTLATATVTGTNYDGISARNSSNSTNLTINLLAAVSGGDSGIYAGNSGSGSTSITTTGVVTGANRYGIYASTTSTTTSLTIDAQNDVTGDENGINAYNLGSGPTVITSYGNIVGTNDAGIYTSTDPSNTGNVGISNITISAGSVTGGTNAILNDGGASNTTVAAAAVITGNIRLGDGSDTLTFNGADISNITLFDGGDTAATTDGFTDVLTFVGSSGAVSAANNWEQVTIDTGTISFAAATLVTASLTVINGGTLDNSTGFALTGNLVNDSIINMVDGDTSDSTTVSADYTSTNGTLNLDTVLGDETSASDRLVITGDSSGNTAINVTNVAGAGALTAADGILVVQVDGASNAVFTLASPLNAGGFDYNLVQVNGNWYLQSQAAVAANPAIIPTLSQWSTGLMMMLIGAFAWFRRNDKGLTTTNK